jgi:hypothetical protein
MRLAALLALLLVGGAVAYALTSFVGASREEPRTQAPEPAGVGADPAATPFDAAVARARALNRPLLVLVLRVDDDCPPADRLRTLFAGPSVLTDCCVLVEAKGGPGAGPAEFQLVSRVRRGPTIPPVLAVVTPALELLHVQAAHLMCFYDGDGRPLPEVDPGPLWGAREITQMVERVMARRAEVDRRLAAAPPPDSPLTRLERAELLAEVGRHAEAARWAPTAADVHLPMPQVRRALAVMVRADDVTPAERFAEQVRAARGEEPGLGWLLLDMRLGGAPGRPEELELAAERARLAGEKQLEFGLRAAGLRARADLAPDPSVAPAVRALHEQSGDVFRGHPNDHARFLDDLVRAAAGSGDLEHAQELVLRLDREHPDSGEAVSYRHGRLDRMRRRSGRR